MKEIRKKFCELKGWSFIHFDDSLECQEYALFVESELEKAKELLKECSRFVDSVQAPRTPAILLKQELTTFLEGSGNKTK